MDINLTLTIIGCAFFILTLISIFLFGVLEPKEEKA